MAQYQQDRQTARLNYQNNPNNQTKREIILASEAVAEAAADQYFHKTEKYDILDYKLGSGKQGEFDRIYAKKDSQGNIVEVVVVECKGGTSPLKCRKKFQQGSTLYMLDIIRNMNKKAPTNELDPVRITTDLLVKITKGNYTGNIILKYCEVRQPFDDAGNLEKTSIKSFYIDKSLFEPR